MSCNCVEFCKSGPRLLNHGLFEMKEIGLNLEMFLTFGPVVYVCECMCTSNSVCVCVYSDASHSLHS